ncbi:MAG TPA: arylesterase [Vicinamibacterales bacterium]|nr:arylesterase [Vicinamibacterales bacterium]
MRRPANLRRLWPLALLVLASACSIRDAACGASLPPAPANTPPEVLSGGAPAGGGGAATLRVAFLGDSLTAGYGLLASQAFPAQLQEMLGAEGFEFEAVNGGISGDTTAGGVRRVEQLMDAQTKVLVVALGANDAIRGLTLQQTHDNLAQILDIALGRGSFVLLCGMEGPTNLGTDYRDAFREVYVNLLREYQGRISFVPFLLEGVAGNPALNQADGIHPNQEGSKIVAKTLLPKLRELVDRAG